MPQISHRRERRPGFTEPYPSSSTFPGAGHDGHPACLGASWRVIVAGAIAALMAVAPDVCLAGERQIAFRKTTPEIRTSNQVSSELFGRGVPTERITLHRAIQMTLTNNLEARFENVGIRVQRARVRFEAGVFDPVFSISANRQSLRRLENINDVRSSDVIRQEQAITSNFALAQSNLNLVNTQRALQGLPPLTIPELNRDTATVGGLSTTTFDVQTNQTETGLVGRTPWGMRYGFQASANRLRNTFTDDTREIVPEYQTLAQVTVIQPLLRNFGPGANMADLRVARLNEKVQVLEWKGRLTSSVQSVMAAYYDMLFALQDIRVREDAIAADQKLVDLYKRRVELGFNSPLDIRQAEVAVSTDREQLLVSKNLFLERQFLLKRQVLEQYQKDDARIFVPESSPNLRIPKLDRSELLRTAFEKRYDYQTALLLAEAQNIRLRFAKNQLLPQLDLIASYGLNGLGTSYGESVEQAFEGHTPTWSVGVNFSIPLGNVQARAQYEATLGEKERAILRIKQTEVTVGADVDTIISRIETNRQRVDTAIQTRQLAEETVRVGYRRLEEGLVSSFDLIEFQRRLYDAKSRELAAIADLNKAITQLWLVTATVPEETGITFREPERR